MADALAVLISIPYMFHTPSMSEKMFIGVYLAVYALAVLISFLLQCKCRIKQEYRCI